MSIYDQYLLDVHAELIVDLFAGGGGASCGIEMATGRQVDVAINHDAAAVSMHQANHPQTTHYVCDVFEADPHEVTQGRPVGLLWASPDCTDHSKAKGGKPIRNKKRRALAWVVKRWAGQVRPRVIALENVEEFVQWGPLVGRPGHLHRDEKRKGKTFRRFVRSLEALGYEVEWRELRACDYGAPTTRKRLFLVARCDGMPVVWPKRTHGGKGQEPYVPAADCIDWTEPMCSIFATPEEAQEWGKAHRRHAPRRPLAEATMRRIARGVLMYVVNAKRPYIVPLSDVDGVAPYLVPRYGERPGQDPRVRSIREPHPVVVPTGNGGSLVAAHLQRDFGASVGHSAGAPLATITPGGGGKAALVTSFLARHWGGMTGKRLTEPFPTVTTKGAQDQVVAGSLAKLRGTSAAADPNEPLHTVSAQGNHHAAVAAFLQKYYGQGTGQSVGDPAPTLTTKDRMGLVTVQVEGEAYLLTDIYMRMLTPRELYRCQGFPESYQIDRGADGRKFTKTEQVRMVGNSVSPEVAAAIVAANAPALVERDKVAVA